MKHLLILFALATIGLSANLVAQEQVETPATTTAETAGTDAKGNINIDINLDDLDDLDENDAEKIGEIVNLVSKYNTELAQELKVELDGLSQEEKAAIVDKLEDGFDVDDIPSGAILIPIVAIIAVFGLPVFLLIVLVTSGHRKRKQKMELVNLYLANDKELPEHVINAFDTGGAANSLRSGLVLTGVGLGLVAAFNESDVGNFGLIPLFLGIARLIYWYLEERKPKQQ